LFAFLSGERVAAELGRALQLTNILRDLAEDAKRHRLYLPRELLHAHGNHSQPSLEIAPIYSMREVSLSA
jgi:phytoene/squalene synthetase